MAASHELVFIAKVIEQRSVKPITDFKITAGHFEDKDFGEIWEWVCDQWRKFGEVPSRQAFKRQWAHISLPNVTDENLDGLIEEMRHAHTMATVAEGLGMIVKHYENENMDAALEALYETYTKAQIQRSALTDVDLTETIPKRLAEYLERQESAGSVLIPGAIPTGFHGLDRITGGYQPGQLIIYTGLAKGGKSQVLMLSMLAAHLYGVPTELFTFEMSAREMGMRFDAKVAGVDSREIQRGTLTKANRIKYEKAIKRLAAYQPLIISQDFSYGTTISSIKSSLQKHQPRALFVDGVYMMTTERFIPSQQERLGVIVADLKGIARDYNIPVIATTQSLAGKTGGGGRLTANSPGYSSAFVQYADALIGVQRHAEIKDMTMLTVLAGRNIQADIEFGIHWDWTHSDFEEVDTGDDDDE